ncbi:MAG: [FeFe] hydrogenase H-cluster radical SAM maturase HydE [Fermentimonas sp.]|nr:[FeFe] hydrogenase H-cluster radical SAM maturase HydE [Fermentimonas sp.]
MTKITRHSRLSNDELASALSSTGEEEQALFEFSSEVKLQSVGNEVYLRGLIEFSNICIKDCFYCGIRKSNSNVHRYSLNHEEVIETVKLAYERGYGSVAIQSGETVSKAFTDKIDRIIRESKRITSNGIGITLSCGEQSEETYKRWFESGTDRYLLRIETSSEELYKKLHSNDELHSYSKRLKALEVLQKTGYQLGTGVMIGLPFQTVEMLAEDLLFMKEIDIDMCGMGPYIEHRHTPLYKFREQLLPPAERFRLGLKMISLLRILMPDINIAATTALQTLDQRGREKAVAVGANVIMPNITPEIYRHDYILYENKPVSPYNEGDELTNLEKCLESIGHKIGYFKQGNSKHYYLGRNSVNEIIKGT